MPVNDYRNAYFVRRLAGSAFGRTASREEFDTTYRMLGHSYVTIRNASVEAIRSLGAMDDVNTLLELLKNAPAESDALVAAVLSIDDKVNSISS